MEKVRYGIIGYGGMGSGHGDFLKQIEMAELTAIADVNPERIEMAKAKFGGDVLYFNSAEELIKSGSVDAIIIAVPHYFHPKYAIMGFENGLHVMTEKPAGVYTRQVREMNAAADSYGRLFGIMYQNRLVDQYQKIHDMVQNGDIGEIRRVNIISTYWYRPQSYYDSGTWRATWAGEGGGVLINQCPHDLDLWQWCVGLMPVKVRAFTHNGRWHDIEVEDDVTAYFEYENGATGVFVASTADYPGTRRFEIQGDKGKIVFENDGKLIFDKLEMCEREFNATFKGGFGSPASERIEMECDSSYPGHLAVLQNFTDAIVEGTPLWIDGREGIKGLTLSNAIHLSSWLDKTIGLPLDEDLYYEELSKRIATSKYKEGSDKVLNVQGTF
jgi:predicted dehydrogenase